MNYLSIMFARSEYDFPISQAYSRFPIENTEKELFYVLENLFLSTDPAEVVLSRMILVWN